MGATRSATPAELRRRDEAQSSAHLGVVVQRNGKNSACPGGQQCLAPCAKCNVPLQERLAAERARQEQVLQILGHCLRAPHLEGLADKEVGKGVVELDQLAEDGARRAAADEEVVERLGEAVRARGSACLHSSAAQSH